MTGQDNSPNPDELFVLALKGSVTVHFLDGQTLAGDYTTQDMWNIFLTVGDRPVMIPRSQILYIQGSPGQAIERDASPAAFPVPEPAADATLFETGELPTGPDRREAPAAAGADTEEHILPAETAGAPVSESEEEEEAVEDTGITFVLDETAEWPAQEEEWDEVTMVLDQDEEEDENETTFVLEAEETASLTARLTCNTGPHSGLTFELTGDTVTLGRASDNDIALPLDKEVSRRHAVIKREGNEFVVQDQHSLNGTFVNNERLIAPRILQDGDIILVGVSDFEYRKL